MEYSLELHVSMSFIPPYSFLQPDFRASSKSTKIPPACPPVMLYLYQTPFATRALVQIWDLIGISLVCAVESCDLYLTKTSVLYYRLL